MPPDDRSQPPRPARRLSLRGYNVLVFGVLLLGLALVGTVNLVVDPRFVFGLVDRPGFNHYKDDLNEAARRFKSARLATRRYDAIILGTSRGELSLDPEHPAFDGRPTFNACLPGTNMHEIHRVFHYAAERQDLQLVVLSLDFLAFTTRRDATGDYEQSGFAGHALAKVYSEALFSWPNFEESRSVLKDNRRYPDCEPEYLDNGRRLLPYRRAPRDAFDFIATKVFLVNPTTYPGFEYGEDRVEMVRDILAHCHERGIRIVLFINPIHARQEEMIAINGLYPQFEQWKRDMARVVAEENARFPEREAAPLWDFSGCNSITTEEVPPAEVSDPMRWWRESSHYSLATGNLVLDIALGHPRRPPEAPGDFGVLLSPDTVEEHLARLRQARREYRDAHPFEIAEVERLYRETHAQRAAALRGEPVAFEE